MNSSTLGPFRFYPAHFDDDHQSIAVRSSLPLFESILLLFIQHLGLVGSLRADSSAFLGHHDLTNICISRFQPKDDDDDDQQQTEKTMKRRKTNRETKGRDE